MRQRKLRALLALILSVLLLSSCALERYSTDKDDSTVAEDSAPLAEEDQGKPQVPEDEKVYRYSGNPDYPILADAYTKALPDKDFNGATFFITSPDVSYIDSNEIHYLSETIAKRNKTVEEKYNIKIKTSRADSDFMLDDALHAAMAGMYYTNIMCIPFGDVGMFAAAGVLMNFRSVPYMDTSAPYFNQSSANALSAGNTVYGVAGEATPVTDLPCVIFNKAIAENYSLPDLYSTALSGNFTWDALYHYSLNVDAASAESGIAGSSLSGGVTYDYIFKSLGESYIFSNEMEIPTAGIANYSMNWTATYVRYMLGSAAAVGITKENSVSAFSEGKVLFTVGTVDKLDDYRNTDVLIGILPMPKESADAPYRSFASENALVMTIPDKSTSSEMSSLVISALNASSYGYMTEKIASYLHATTLPDNRSADVLELISRSAVYDLSTAFEDTVTPIYNLKTVVRDIIEIGDFALFEKSVTEMNDALKEKFPLSY
ncbi:MAG: extracellular solute-binding protein [Clostridia bacterium]|nr:extracellular solute-binding protein [Clostridia bacterium]